MFWESLKITGSAVAQIFILGAMGYFLIKMNILSREGLNSLSRLVVDVIMPILIFCQLTKDFSFSLYPNWWMFPLISIGITLAGLLVGLPFAGFIKSNSGKMQFLNLVAFQNSGFLPLALVAALLPYEQATTMFTYLFLFLLGFNLLLFSMGAYLLTFSKEKKFDWASLFSAPVAATVFSLVFIFFGFQRYVPEVVFKPLRLVGDTFLTLSMFVVGGNLALISLSRIDKKAISLMVLAKMIILPVLGLWFVFQVKLPDLIGLLILIEVAMPSATLLSVITNHYKKEDLLISHGIFISHIFGLLTIPLFLSLYFSRFMIK